MRHRHLVYLLLIFTIVGCSSRKLSTALTPMESYQRGEKAMNEQDYLEATEAFRAITTNFPGSDLVDDAQYGLAEAYFRLGEYTTAISEYEKLVREYPLSEFIEKAQFGIGDCYFRQSLPAQLDQESTNEALERFNRFIQEYPNSELVLQVRQKILLCRNKLAKKNYLNGELYKKLKVFDAALYYYQLVVSQFSDTKWTAPAEFEIGEILLRRSEKALALEAFQRALAGNLDGKLKKRIAERIEEIKEER